MSEQKPNLEGIAIVGMAGRFPGARNVEEFWRNQLNGVEAISHFRVDELEVSNAAELAKDPNYVCARSVLEDVDLFDAEFFGIYPREAELMDPQHRLFMESCWQALEDAGYDPASYTGEIGVYAGCSPATYFLSRICSRPGFIDKFTGGYQVGNYPEMLGSSLDFLSTRVSYKLNLRGPSFTMQAGCSTSLLAVTQACQSLLTYQCDMALAGASSITIPQKRGSFYQEGGMISPDGHCRTFDANAQGTVFGSGVAVVLLKRLEDAVRDGDQIYAVIKGFAANNDGSSKVGYTAPSVEGQARVIALAQASAGVNPETIGYIEAHGTGTPLGDPIELAAATQAFRAHTQAKGFCAIGTAKTNVGHLDVAAGVTGLIHASHIVRHGVFSPTLHFQKPNPKFDLENSPFYVNKQRAEWKSDGRPRRAGVSAFGVGGTNAHVVIEQAPEQAAPAPVRGVQLLTLSARSEAALDRATDNLAEHLKNHGEANFEDVAWTLQAGRRAFPCRRSVAARNANEAIAALLSRDHKTVQTRLRPLVNREVSFLFPGQGSQHPNMGREIYESEPVFRAAVDRCSEILHPLLGADLTQLLYPNGAVSDEARRRVTETILAQPAIFTIEYALAQLWMSWGVRPHSMLGHSIGEFVAACLAGVFSLEDALRLVATRGAMMQKLPAGGMLSVRLPEAEIRKRLNGQLSLAAVNSPSLCVVSGPAEALEELEAQLEKEGAVSRRLVTSHAFHSAMMDPITQPFTECCAQVKLNAPRIPYVSGVTGTWITAEQATDPEYWSRHFREPVQFSAGVKLLRENVNAVLVEVGPGNVLTALARQHAGFSSEQVIVPSLADGYSGEDDAVALMNALGAVWLAGVQPNWTALYHGTQRQRVSLPTYPFERKRYWIETPEAKQVSMNQDVNAQQNIPAAPVPEAVAEETKQVSTSTLAGGPNSTNRVARITKILAEIFEDLSGTDLSKADGATTFLEMGFDSLFLTQVTQALQSKFGLKITFRQLLGDQSSLSALAPYIDSKLPADVLAEPVPAPVAPAITAPMSPQAQVPSAPVYAAAGSSIPTVAVASVSPGSAVERMMREQIQAMNELFARQLEALRGTSSQATLAASPAIQAVAQPSTQPASAPPPAPAPAAQTAPAPRADKDTKELKGYTPFKPLQKSSSSDLTPRQRDYIASLVDRYTRRTAGSKAKTQEYRQPLADPRVVSGFRSEWKEMVYPIITVRSKGSHLWDVDGNEYIDLLNGFGPIMLGHRPDFVERAVEKQLHEGFEIGPQTLLAGEVAKMICEFTGNERATFCNTGSEAVVAAMRVARTVTGRNKIVFFAGDYHGMFDEVLVKGIRRGGVPQAVPVAPGIPREKAANVVVLEYGAPDSLEWIRANANDLAAVMVEPVQSRHPALQPVEFLKELRQITEASDTCLIFDEVVTGFRVHPGGCQALFDIRADLATYGKVLAGGMPIGVLAGKAKYMDALDGGTWQFGDDSYPTAGVTFFAGTFVRHPLALAAAKAVLEYLKQQGPELQRQLTKKTGEMVARLNEILSKYGVPSHIENFASILYFGFPADYRFGSLFYYHLREKGIHVLEGFPCFLTTEHTDADIERVVRAFEEAAAAMRAGGVLPGEGVDEKHAELQVATAEPALVASSAMTEPQLEVWLSDQLSDEASCSYNESFTLRMRGNLNQSALKQAIQQVIARHDALRSSFDGETHRVRFASDLTIEIPFLDLATLSPAERETRVREIVEQDAHTPFRLAEAPLVRAQLIALEPEHTLLIFTSHHIVCDGWSTNVLLDELSTLYNSLVRGTSCELPRAMSFAQYAAAQADFAHSDEGRKIEKFWLDQFQNLPPVLDLPCDRPRPALKQYSGATYRHKIGLETYASVKKLGATQKCTLFVTLLSAFQLLLSRLSGQDDIVVGIPTAGQSLVDDVLVGHCVNFIPLRSSVNPDMRAADFLAQVRQAVLAGYEHQNYTYGSLVRKLALRRDPSRLPLTEVQFNLERVGEGLQFDGLAAEVDPNPKSFVNFDMFLNIVESKDGLVLDCDFNTGLFDEATIARWLGHYETLLRGMVADAQQSVSSLPLLTPQQKRFLVHGLNDTAVAFSPELLAHSLFERQARQTPEAGAVVFEQKELTYAELDARANQLARYLRQSGVEPGALVAVFVERSLEMIVALLAVMKAGAAYVPMDPTFPPDRLRFVLEDAQVRAVLTQEPLTHHWRFGNARVILLDSEWDAISGQSAAPLEASPRPDDLAYVIYTSGSTGRPKGVEVTHRAVANFLQAMLLRPGLGAEDRLAAVTTLSFDIAGLELYLPLCVGARLIIVSRETASFGTHLLDYLKETKTTIMQATPVTWKLLIESGWQGDPPLKVLCGGEAFPRELANALVKRSNSVWNMYGPTETTIWSAVGSVEAGDGPVPLGAPIANTSFYVVDSHAQLVPIGVSGELCIGGAGLARGYLNRPELTSEKFVADPFAADPAARMYRTGDLVRRRADGSIEFLGRMDDQIKLRGFRVELGEIQSVLAMHPGVGQAVVMLREDIPGEKRLVAYLVPANGAAPSAAELRSFLLDKVPDYMVPAAFLTLDVLPMTPNGKIDRRALPAPDWGRQSCGAAYLAPRTAEEQKMAAIWAEVLHLDRVGINDSLFELGADSLHVFQIAARAVKDGIAVTPRQILQHRNIAAIMEVAGANGKAAPSEIKPVARNKYRLVREVQPVGPKA